MKTSQEIIEWHKFLFSRFFILCIAIGFFIIQNIIWDWNLTPNNNTDLLNLVALVGVDTIFIILGFFLCCIVISDIQLYEVEK